MSSCVIPGSFDPVTRGHVDLIRRASRIFDRVTVVIMINIHKKGTFTPEERVSLLEKASGHSGGPRGPVGRSAERLHA